tara:strand:- start:273 stop:1175 length:903 start_codon:yes stop_codon:yes gene_type:complete
MSCDFKEDVIWTIDKDKLNQILFDKKNGLLFKKFEYAGSIVFDDDESTCEVKNIKKQICNEKSCKILNDTYKSCNKKIKKTEIKKGDKDSVSTPLSIINFHTHPLSCYIDNNTIWGWPSGEDLRACIDFALNGNLIHVIFALEGTYLIKVNFDLLKYIKNKNTKECIEQIFQYTHRYRCFDEDNLINNFKITHLNVLGIEPKEFIVESWLDLVNSITLNFVALLCNNLNIKYKASFGIRDLNKKIFQVQLIKNYSFQWNNQSKEKKFEELKLYSKLKNNIELPEKISFVAPFVSSSCKLN